MIGTSLFTLALRYSYIRYDLHFVFHEFSYIFTARTIKADLCRSIGNKAKGRISKRIFQDKERQIFPKMKISYLLISIKG